MTQGNDPVDVKTVCGECGAKYYGEKCPTCGTARPGGYFDR